MASLEYYKCLFLTRYEELKSCHDNMDNYKLIAITSVLRLLLFDSPALVDILTKENRASLKFTVNDDPNFKRTEEEIATMMMLWMEINPAASPYSKELNKNAFLKWPCVYYMGTKITVLDVLKFYGYCRGGIHLPKENDTKYDKMKEVFELIKINGLSQLDHSMRGIVQVVYTALTKYKDQLLA